MITLESLNFFNISNDCKINVYRGVIYVQSTEMEEIFSALKYKNVQIGNNRINTI